MPPLLRPADGLKLPGRLQHRARLGVEAVAGLVLLASDESARRYPYETVNAAIKMTDLLFERIKDQRDIQEKAS